MAHGEACIAGAMILYFAYGSNMWKEQMRKRCPDSRRIGSGVLSGYRWIISSRGFATILRSAGSAVRGTVYELSSADERALDSWEGVDRGRYRREFVSVEVNGASATCLVYIDTCEDEGLPAEEYVRRINLGVTDACLPFDYVVDTIRRFVPE